MSKAGVPFSAANFLTTINYQDFEDMTYWDSDIDSDNFDEGEYILYLTEAGSDQAFFESASIDFNLDTEYVLMLRTNTGVIKNNIKVNMIINSPANASYADADASAQYRVYNSLDNEVPLTLNLDGNGEYQH